MRLFSLLFKDNTGATAVEYGLLAAILAVTLFVALGNYYDRMNAMFSGLSDLYSDAAQ